MTTESNRINVENLKKQAMYLSDLTGMDLTIEGAYGGYRLVRNDAVTGVNPITTAFEPKRALSKTMFAIQDAVYAMRSESAPDLDCPVCVGSRYMQPLRNRGNRYVK